MKILFTRDNRMSGPVVVAKDGSYSVSLAPGSYWVSVDQSAIPSGNGVTPVTPERVRVVARANRRVDFRIDTGIR